MNGNEEDNLLYICRKLSRPWFQIFSYFCLMLEQNKPQVGLQCAAILNYSRAKQQYRSLGRCGIPSLVSWLLFTLTHTRRAMITFCKQNKLWWVELGFVSRTMGWFNFRFILFYLSDARFRRSQTCMWHFVRIHKLCSQSCEVTKAGNNKCFLHYKWNAYLQRWHSYINFKE